MTYRSRKLTTTTLKNRLIITIKNMPAESKKIAEGFITKNKPAESKRITMEFTTAGKSEKIAVECSSREPRLRRLTTTLTTPMNIHKTNVHQLTANSPITNTLRDTVKKPYPCLPTIAYLPNLATNPPDHMQTHKMGLDMAMVERMRYEEY